MSWLKTLLFKHDCLLCGESTTTSPCSFCLTPTPILDLPPPPLLTRLITAYPYEGPAGDLIRISKATRERAPIQRLCSIVAQTLGPTLLHQNIDAIVPVPAHWRTQVWRGFNAPDLLANSLSIQLKCDTIQVLTNRSASAQKSRTKLARRLHAQQRFHCTVPIKSAHLLLVDDIATTGATLTACASELLGSGATSVSAMTLCAVP